MKAQVEKPVKKKNDKVTTIVCCILVVASLALFVGKLVLKPVSIVGSSMYPTYIEGEIVKTRKFDAETEILKHDMVIVLNSTISNKQLIKRIVAVEGDQVQIIDGRLYRNGRLVLDGFPKMNEAGLLSDLLTVSKGCVVVLGDNRNASQDSRDLGEIPLENITAIVEEKIIEKQPEGMSSRNKEEAKKP